jgi:hypothetical protein
MSAATARTAIGADQASVAGSSLVRIDEFSRRKGVPIPTLRRWVRAGRIVFFQPGGKGGTLYFPLDAIERGAAASGSAGQHDAAEPLPGRRPLWMDT